MSLGEKRGLDALLGDWPALPASRSGEEAIDRNGEPAWEARAEAVVKAALAGGPPLGDADLDALLAPPALPAEPGEGGQTNVLVAVSAGEKKMSQENDSGAAPPSIPPERKPRSSLKAMAERASQAGARAPTPSTPSGGGATVTPLPTSVRPSMSSRPSIPSAPMSRPSEAGKEDSGVINLNAVRTSATPQQVADAEKAKPATEGIFDEDKPEAAAAAAAPVAAKAAKPVAAPPAKGGNGVVIGIGIALVGLAAAFAITMREKPAAPEKAVSPVAAEVKPAATAEQKAAPTATATAVAANEPAASATAEPDKPAESAKVATGGTAAGTGGPLPKEPGDEGKVAVAPKGGAATPGKAPGDLQSEMAKAVGADGQPKQQKGDGAPEPAAAARNQNLPEQPSQGSVQSAIGAVMGGAKACVAGADDVSRAQVTFSSNGTVSSVSVTGWAAAHGQSGCVKAALKGAKVGAFSKPSFTVGVPIRP